MSGWLAFIKIQREVIQNELANETQLAMQWDVRSDAITSDFVDTGKTGAFGTFTYADDLNDPVSHKTSEVIQRNVQY